LRHRNFAARRLLSPRIRASDDGEDCASEPYPIIEKTLAALRAGDPGHNRLVIVDGNDLVHCEVAPASIDRLGKILGEIVMAARKQGFVLEEGTRRAQFAGDGETLGISVTEVFQRIKHEPTPAELAKQEAWQKRRERRRYSWNLDYEPYPSVADWDYVCTGRLGFEMEGIYVAKGGGPRKTFRDAKIQRLENMSSYIAVALAVMAVAKREERERRNAEERKRLKERREREQPLRLKHIAEPRNEALNQVLNDLADLERLRRLIEGLSALERDDQSPRVSTFLAWSQSELRSRVEAFSRKGLERRFEAECIFGDDDDHAFQSKYWY
jgi:hypothetical protein